MPCGIYSIIDLLAENITKILLMPNQFDKFELGR